MLRFNEKIREIRKSKGLTQKSLGKLINKSAQVVSNWERGYTTTINQDDIQNIAKAFNIKISELMNEDEYSSYSKSAEMNQSKDLAVFLEQPEIVYNCKTYEINPALRYKLKTAIDFAFYEEDKKSDYHN